MDVPDSFAPALGWKALNLFSALYAGKSAHYSPGAYVRNRSREPHVSLESPYATGCVWWSELETTPVWMEAECSSPWGISPNPACGHPENGVPSGDGQCGFYAHYRHKGLVVGEAPGRILFSRNKDNQPYPYGARVVALVLGGGLLRAHEKEGDGFRSETMKVIALIRPEKDTLDDVLEMVADAMNVPLMGTHKEAQAYGNERGVDVWPMVKRQMETDELEGLMG